MNRQALLTAAIICAAVALLIVFLAINDSWRAAIRQWGLTLALGALFTFALDRP